jgi:hypothetical protein
MIVVVCTDRGRHREQVIEVLERNGGPGGHWSALFGSRKEAYDATLSALLDLGVVPDSKLLDRDGKLDSRHRGGVQTTRHGTEVVCPRCHRRYSFRGTRFYRGLDAAVEAGMDHIDLSELCCR